MAARQTLPIREVLRGRRINWVDVVVGAAIIAVLYTVVRLGQSMSVNFTPGRTPVKISTDISNVPYYAARSLLRMFIALGLSTVFTLVYGTAAARLRRAEKVLVPILDILQSIPILVFLPIALTFFITVFPNNLLGLELASIFVIFTSQAWNMTFSFYHSLICAADRARRGGTDVPAHQVAALLEARRAQLDDRIGLEHDDVDGRRLVLPDRLGGRHRLHQGSRDSPRACPAWGATWRAAVAQGSYTEVTIAIVVMVILVVGTNFFVFRPLVAWSDKFRLETLRVGGQAEERRPRHPAPLVDADAARPADPARGPCPRPGHPPVRAGRVPACTRTRAQRQARRRHLLGRSSSARRRLVAVIGIIYLNAHLGFAHFPIAHRPRVRDLRPGRRPAGHLDAHLGAGGREDRHEPEAVPLRPTRRAGAGQLPGHPAVPVRHAHLHRPRDTPRTTGPSCS